MDYVSLLDCSPCVMSFVLLCFSVPLYLSLSADCLWHHLQCAVVQMHTTYVLFRSLLPPSPSSGACSLRPFVLHAIGVKQVHAIKPLFFF
ncbi:MAG: hypothetical protein J3Q66DRAFT_341929 [Benniella sp.]|nr:MAG: hypothetical protein J3Q66DRAFT_341929 [Benniella sp.]